MTPDYNLLQRSLKCRCPQCGEGALYRSRYSVVLRDECSVCGLDFTKNDSADGPAVFLIFILGTLLVPLAIWFEFAVAPPLWAHAVIWGIATLALTLGALKPLKSYIIALQFKHRRGDWE